ncbi:tetratricopeptide repeat protein [Desulfovulcanus sp.]
MSRFKKKKHKDDSSFLKLEEGYLPPSGDTFAAIGELSRVVKNNPDAVEIYLALGNLFRAQGEIERAIQIRQNLIARPNLDDQFKARAWFELGNDFKRAGLVDRAVYAFEKAQKIVGPEPAILGALARLFAESNDFKKAAEYYSRLDQLIPQAHYLVRWAKQLKARQQSDSGRKALQKALKVYPGSVEAWLELIIRDYQKKNWRSLAKNLSHALASVSANLKFVLLEGLYQFARRESDNSSKSLIDFECSQIVVETVSGTDQDLLLSFYCALFLLASENEEQAKDWLEKTLVLGPDFWPARLELLALTEKEQELTDSFRVQLEFFLQKARLVKRFICSRCGLKREQIFFVCPRCHSWHSISFRTRLND